MFTLKEKIESLIENYFLKLLQKNFLVFNFFQSQNRIRTTIQTKENKPRKYNSFVN